MPKRLLKKSPSKKPTAVKAKKPTAKPLVKKTAKAPPPHEHKGFMWKLLERKQAELKRMNAHPKHPYAHADHKPADLGGKVQSYTRFNGPRRKAA